MDENAIKIILDILRRRNDIEIKRKGDGYVIIEVVRKPRYRVSGRLGNSDEVEKENKASAREAPHAQAKSYRS